MSERAEIREAVKNGMPFAEKTGYCLLGWDVWRVIGSNQRYLISSNSTPGLVLGGETYCLVNARELGSFHGNYLLIRAFTKVTMRTLERSIGSCEYRIVEDEENSLWWESKVAAVYSARRKFQFCT